MLAYQYDNRGDLLKAQKALLGLCMFLKRNLVAYRKFHLKVLFYDMIFHVLKRSELGSESSGGCCVSQPSLLITAFAIALVTTICNRHLPARIRSAEQGYVPIALVKNRQEKQSAHLLIFFAVRRWGLYAPVSERQRAQGCAPVCAGIPRFPDESYVVVPR